MGEAAIHRRREPNRHGGGRPAVGAAARSAVARGSVVVLAVLAGAAVQHPVEAQDARVVAPAEVTRAAATRTGGSGALAEQVTGERTMTEVSADQRSP